MAAHHEDSQCLIIAALRKRVEELEIGAGSAALTIRLAKERAEKAERERSAALESLASYQAASHNYVRCYELNRQLRADLDAALLVCGSTSLDEPALEAAERVRELLAEREAKRG